MVFLKNAEQHFEGEDFLCVKTPILVPSPAMESSLHAFKVGGSDFYLPTSPEFALKKLWFSSLSDKIFEIAPSFRAKELGASHLDEFTMLEFYIEGGFFEDLKSVTTGFLNSCFEKDMKPVSLALPELFWERTSFELKPDSDEDFLRSVLDYHSIEHKKLQSWTDLFHMILINLVEPLFCQERLIYIEDFPPQLSALAKINKRGWASRLEIYLGGLELGNGYDELIDSEELKRRWLKENALREEERFAPHPFDKELIDLAKMTKLRQGIGMALGLERIFYLLNPAKDIKVWPF